MTSENGDHDTRSPDYSHICTLADTHFVVIKLVTGYPYMITTNTDAEDGLMNGAIGTLIYIEQIEPANSDDNARFNYGYISRVLSSEPSCE